MHFTTLFIMRNKKLEDVSIGEVEEEFAKRYCYCCERPTIQEWCDWFQIGGRWNSCKVLQATRGLKGTNGVGEGYEEPSISVCEIKDLTAPVDRTMIYSVATATKIYTKNGEWQTGAEINKDKFTQLLDDIDNKKFKGVIAVIDCHD